MLPFVQNANTYICFVLPTLSLLVYAILHSLLAFIHLSALMTVTLETWISCQGFKCCL